MLGFIKKLFGLPTEAEKAAAKVNPVIARAEAGKVKVETAKAKAPAKKTAKAAKPAKAKKPASKK